MVLDAGQQLICRSSSPHKPVHPLVHHLALQQAVARLLRAGITMRVIAGLRPWRLCVLVAAAASSVPVCHILFIAHLRTAPDWQPTTLNQEVAHQRPRRGR